MPQCTPAPVCIQATYPTPTRLTLSLSGPCYRPAEIPQRRSDPRYLAIGEELTHGGVCVTAPLRSTRSRKRPCGCSITLSHSRDSSRAATPSDPESEVSADVPLAVIQPEVARPLIDKFRLNVLSGADRSGCAISGKGKAWLNGLPGVGVEAAHVVPQRQWAVYPVNEGGIARVEVEVQLEAAWRRTWMQVLVAFPATGLYGNAPSDISMERRSSNGLPLLSHLHQCFDARLISIHPRTKRVRAFVAYDVLTEYHGHDAFLPLDIDERVLEHHYDMCCIENLVAPWIPRASPSPGNNWTSAPAVAASTEGGTAPPDQSVTNDIAPLPPTNQAAHPLSPPSSELGGKGKYLSGAGVEGQQGREILTQQGCSTREVYRERVWLQGAKVISDPQEAEALRKRGWILRETHRECERRSTRPSRWLCGAQEIDDPQKAEDLMQQGWILQEVEEEEEEDGDDTERLQVTEDRVRQWLLLEPDEGRSIEEELSSGLSKRVCPATDGDWPAEKQRL